MSVSDQNTMSGTSDICQPGSVIMIAAAVLVPNRRLVISNHNADSIKTILWSTRLRLRLRQCLFNQNRYHIRFTKNTNIQKFRYWYMMNLRHIGRPPLRSDMTAGMGATRRGRACTCSKSINNATFWWRGVSHGGHRCYHHCGILTVAETPEPTWGLDIRTSFPQT